MTTPEPIKVQQHTYILQTRRLLPQKELDRIRERFIWQLQEGVAVVPAGWTLTILTEGKEEKE